MERIVLTLSVMLFAAVVLHSQDGHPLNQLLTLRAQKVRRGLLTRREWPMSWSAPLIGSGGSDREGYHPMVGSQSSPPILRPRIHTGRLMVASWFLIQSRARASSYYRELSNVIQSEPDSRKTALPWRWGRRACCASSLPLEILQEGRKPNGD
jgi:hypothetical protein